MSISFEMLLHPELLTNEQLIYIIQERHLRIPNIERMERDEILQIFHHYCVPYGQRKYRDSGRGRVLNRARPTSPESPSKLHTMVSQSNKNTNPHCSRLKPPPDLLSGHMKRIKLENTTHTIPTNTRKNINEIKRKMSIDSMPLATDSPPPKKERKPITWP